MQNSPGKEPPVRSSSETSSKDPIAAGGKGNQKFVFGGALLIILLSFIGLGYYSDPRFIALQAELGFTQ